MVLPNLSGSPKAALLAAGWDGAAQPCPLHVTLFAGCGQVTIFLDPKFWLLSFLVLSVMQFICLGEDGEISLWTVKSFSVCPRESSPSNVHGGGKEMSVWKLSLEGY